MRREGAGTEGALSIVHVTAPILSVSRAEALSLSLLAEEAALCWPFRACWLAIASEILCISERRREVNGG